MTNLLLDSSILIDFLRQKQKEHSTFFQLLNKEYTLYVSIITHTELYAGKNSWTDKTAQEELLTLFSGLEIISLNEIISKEAGKLKATYDMHLFDSIIAATAIVEELQLVTLNIKDFKQVTALSLYSFK